MTRTISSVPEGRSSTRPESPSSADTAATAADNTGIGRRTRPVDAAHVHEHLRVDGHDRREVGERAPGAGHLGHEVQAGQHAVAGRGVLAHDDVARLLAAEREAALGHRLEHVAVADAGLHDRDAVVGHRPVQAEVAHDRGDERVVDEVPALLHRHRQDRP